MFDLKDKVAVLTGATGTLGTSIAKSLALSGVKLALIARNEDFLKSSVEELSNYSNDLMFCKVDVLKKEELVKASKKIIDNFKSVDILINAVGGNLPGATILDSQTIFDLSEKDFDDILDLNLKGTILPSLVFGEIMSKSGSGSIVNYSSMAVDRVLTRVVGYSAAKAAMENFTRWMAVEMAIKFGDGIRVNAISPGFFIAKQNKKLLINEDGTLTDRGNKILRNTPMNRFGKPEELNGVIHFLCSNSASFVTGTVIPVDGGFNAFSGV